MRRRRGGNAIDRVEAVEGGYAGEPREKEGGTVMNWTRWRSACRVAGRATHRDGGRPATRGWRSRRMSLEALESRQLLTTTTLPPSAAFDAIDYDEAVAITGDAALPIEADGAVGLSHYVSIAAGVIRWQSRVDGLAHAEPLTTPAGGGSAFFDSLSPSGSIADAKVAYDRNAERFLVAAIERTVVGNGDSGNVSRILLAASTSGDPSAAWEFTAIDARESVNGGDTWADDLGFTVNGNAVFVTASLKSFASGSPRVAGRLWVLDKNALYAGTNPTAARYDPYASVSATEYPPLLPARYVGDAPSDRTFLLGMGDESGPVEQVYAFGVENPLANLSFRSRIVAVGNVHDNGAAFPGASQPGAAGPLPTGDGRIADAVWRGNTLYAVNTTIPPTGVDAGQETVRWYRFSTILSFVVLEDSGVVDGESLGAGTVTFDPAIHLDAAETATVSYYAADGANFPGLYAAQRLATDPAGTIGDATPVFSGVDAFERTQASGESVWMTGSSLVVDPANGEALWSLAPRAVLRGSPSTADPPQHGRWATRWSPIVGDPAGRTIGGVKWEDLDGDGVRDVGEPGVPGWTVYLDANANGVLDVGESRTTTRDDDPTTTAVDESGRYAFRAVPAGDYAVRFLPLAGWSSTYPAQAHVVALGATPLTALAQNLAARHEEITGTIGNRYAFSGGDVGTSIVDGGDDMFDVGNVLNTNLAAEIPYTDGQVAASDGLFGAGSHYFTAKHPALFALGVSGMNVDYFEITGETGADGAGTVDGATLSANVDGRGYRVFLKRTTGAGDPSIQHILIVPSDGPSPTQEFSTSTNSDQHRLANLTGVRELYYLLVARRNGVGLSNTEVQQTAEAFLRTLPTTGADAANVDFGDRLTGKLDGFVFRDQDRDGIRGPLETGLAGWSVYADANNNGLPDVGEPAARSVADDPATTNVDETGRFVLANLPTGRATIRMAPQSGYQPTAGSSGIVATVAEVDLESSLASIADEPGAITGDIAGLYDFSEGETGTTIVDGGGMYASGNVLSTDLADEIAYTNGQVVDADGLFGPQSRYFTAKLPGLFVLAAENVSIHSFSVAGGTAAAPHGQVDGGAGTIYVGGEPYRMFVKRVYGGGSPSINQIVVVRGGGAAIGHTFASDPTEDTHRVDGLSGAEEIYYLVAAIENGAYMTDAAAASLAERFLAEVVRRVEPQEAAAFGNYPGGEVSGIVWNDVDGDRVRDAGEPGLTGWTVYVDANDNGQFDPGEISAATQDDDAGTPQVDEAGRYVIEGLSHATHRVRAVLPGGWSETFPVAGSHDVAVGAASLADVLADLNEAGTAIASLIPDRFDFSEGTSGSSISDGGSDMFDSGNQLVTTRGGTNRTISYSNLSIVGASNRFGPSSTYFTAKYAGLFVLAAKDIEIDSFRVDGGLGADGEGMLDTRRFVTIVGGQTYTVFTKRVYGATNPSVNHLIILPGIGAGVTRTVSESTNDDLHRLDGLSQTSELYYLMFGTTAGGYVSDLDMNVIATAFLEQIAPGFDAANVDFGHRELADNGVIRGSVWNDIDGDGVRDGNENGHGNWAVILDTNDNGRYDNGEPTAITATDDPATPDVNESGTYEFLGLSAGSYVVTVIPTVVNAVTFPAMDYRGRRSHYVLLSEGEIREAVDFGARPRRADLLVRGGTIEISNGSSSTSIEQGTYFGYADISGDTATATFSLFNVGDSTLVFSSNPPVQLTGTGAADYAVTSQPPSSLAPGASATFAVRFDPALTGTRRATVSIASNDPDAPTYTFLLEGIGAASATVLANDDFYVVNEDSVISTGIAEVVPARSSWRYFEDMRRGPGAQYPTDASPGDTWKDRGYDMNTPSFGTWKGPSAAPFAVGAIDGFQLPVTPLSDAFIPAGGSTAVTALFRTNFTLNAATAAATSGIVRALCDDGCVGYINGVEVFRERMPAGPPSPTTEATATGSEIDYVAYNIDFAALGVPLFADGGNVFAVEVHQFNSGSSDLGFDATLGLPGGAVGVLDNDTRPTNATVTVFSPPVDASGRQVGDLVFRSDNSGNFTYTPPRDYSGGVVRFRYLLGDGSSNRSNAQVSILVQGTNDPPRALDDAYAGRADQPLVIAAGAPLIEATGHLWWYADDGRDHDTLNPSWKFGPAAGFSPGAAGWKGPSPTQLGVGEGDEQTPVMSVLGTGSFTHYAYCTFDAPGNPETLVLELKRDDGAAVYINGVEVVTDNLPTPHPFNAPSLANANDDGQSFQRFVIPTSGLALSPTGNTIAVEIHQWDISSSDMSFDLRLFDPTRGLLANDEDADHPPSSLSAIMVEPAFDDSVGTLSVQADGSLTFTPAHSAVSGDFTFTYRAHDAAGALSSPATVTLSITPTDRGPVVAADDVGIVALATMEDTPLAIDASTGPTGPIGIGLLANDEHPGEENVPLVLEVVSPPASGGSVSLSATQPGGFTYTPGADFDGIDSFSYRVFDGVSYSNTAIVNIVVLSVDDPPWANDDEFLVRLDTPLVISDPAAGVLANDVDVEEDPLEQAEVVLGQEAQHGVLVFEPNGTFSYTPSAGFLGVDQFQYTVAAGGLRSQPATVTLRVEESVCAEDFDLSGDGAVDLADVALLVAQYAAAEPSQADFDCSGVVDLRDAIALRNAISTPPAPMSPQAVLATARRVAAVDRAIRDESLAAIGSTERRVRRVTRANDGGDVRVAASGTAAPISQTRKTSSELRAVRRVRAAGAALTPPRQDGRSEGDHLHLADGHFDVLFFPLRGRGLDGLLGIFGRGGHAGEAGVLLVEAGHRRAVPVGEDGEDVVAGPVDVDDA